MEKLWEATWRRIFEVVEEPCPVMKVHQADVAGSTCGEEARLRFAAVCFEHVHRYSLGAVKWLIALVAMEWIAAIGGRLIFCACFAA